MPMSPGITAMIEYVLCAWLVLHNAVLSQAAPAESWLPLERAKHRKDQVTDIPGLQDKLTSKHYAGYIDVDEEHGRRLWYYFATSQRSPENDPLVLWLNGGPGCSSLDGFVYEHGPFKMSLGPDKAGPLTLTENPFAWSKVANIIYLDSPVGVGLSYSETKADYDTNDTKTALDSNTFVRRFLEQYPEFDKHPLYVIGESYAGVYVPTLARQILHSNEDGSKPFVNIQGYAVGNGVTDEEIDGNAVIPFAYGQSLLSHEEYHRVHRECQGSFWNVTQGSSCDDMLNEVYNSLTNINIYNILEPCYHGGAPRQQAVQAARQSPAGRQWPLGGGAAPGPVPRWDQLLGAELGHVPPCLDSREMWAFANSDPIRHAIHAEPISAIGKFDECSDRITYNHDLGSMLPIHEELLHTGLRALIYSGDHDMCVPHTGSEEWTRSLGLEVKHGWRQWNVDHQVAGYSQHYEGLTFVTIKGAGHTVPQSKPREALHMLDSFLQHRVLT